MHIAFAASEGVPFSKTGGLADVVGALPQAHRASGPRGGRYPAALPHDQACQPAHRAGERHHPLWPQSHFPAVLEGPPRTACEPSSSSIPPFFDRDALYGTPEGDYPDNAERFALFSRAVLEAAKLLGPPDVIHCHDWQTALVPVLLRTLYAEDPSLHGVGVVFTIHNLGYQGLFPPDTLPLLLLPWDLFTIRKMEFFGKVNFLKGALTESDYVNTVSRKYARRSRPSEYGFGLEGVLRARAATVTGILNGVDYAEWSPQRDKFIAQNYSASDLSGKAACKHDLLREFKLPESCMELPVIGIVSRFTAQKGSDLISQVADRLAREELVIVALGTGDARVRRALPAHGPAVPAEDRGQASPTTTRWRTRSRPAPTCS